MHTESWGGAYQFVRNDCSVTSVSSWHLECLACFMNVALSLWRLSCPAGRTRTIIIEIKDNNTVHTVHTVLQHTQHYSSHSTHSTHSTYSTYSTYSAHSTYTHSTHSTHSTTVHTAHTVHTVHTVHTQYTLDRTECHTMHSLDLPHQAVLSV